MVRPCLESCQFHPAPALPFCEGVKQPRQKCAPEATFARRVYPTEGESLFHAVQDLHPRIVYATFVAEADVTLRCPRASLLTVLRKRMPHASGVWQGFLFTPTRHGCTRSGDGKRSIHGTINIYPNSSSIPSIHRRHSFGTFHPNPSTHYITIAIGSSSLFRKNELAGTRVQACPWTACASAAPPAPASAGDACVGAFCHFFQNWCSKNRFCGL